MSKLRFFNIFFLKPGLTKTFYLMNDLQFSLVDYVCFMLENFKKKIYDMGSVGIAFRAIPRWIRLVMGFPKMPKLRMSIHF